MATSNDPEFNDEASTTPPSQRALSQGGEPPEHDPPARETPAGETTARETPPPAFQQVEDEWVMAQPVDPITMERPVLVAERVEPVASRHAPVRRRRVRLPVILFLVTCLSTFWVGANHWLPIPIAIPFRQMLAAHWQDGLIYTACVLGILLTHEMGHFLATIRHRIPASFPFFIPFPISPIGTMGAVIGMDGMRADRKQMFDIGLAGPLAGLAVALPIMWIGIARLDLTQPGYGPFAVDTPLIVRLGMQYLQPPGYEPGKLIWFSQLNPYFMAGWVGFLITGLNMIPVSQLDGGHVTYTLFGKAAHWMARGFMLVAVAYILFARQWNWSLMVILVLLMGTDHPPTRDDTVPLGRVRTAIGWCAILIPLFSFAPRLLIFP